MISLAEQLEALERYVALFYADPDIPPGARIDVGEVNGTDVTFMGVDLSGVVIETLPEPTSSQASEAASDQPAAPTPEAVGVVHESFFVAEPLTVRDARIWANIGALEMPIQWVRDADGLLQFQERQEFDGRFSAFGYVRCAPKDVVRALNELLAQLLEYKEGLEVEVHGIDLRMQGEHEAVSTLAGQMRWKWLRATVSLETVHNVAPGADVLDVTPKVHTRNWFLKPAAWIGNRMMRRSLPTMRQEAPPMPRWERLRVTTAPDLHAEFSLVGPDRSAAAGPGDSPVPNQPTNP